MGNVSVTLSGIHQTIGNLNYRPGSVKYKAVRAIGSFYTTEESPSQIQAIDTDTLIARIWEVGTDPSKIRSKRRNFSSLRSSINSDLKKLAKKDLNPESIIISDANVFDMTEEAKTSLLHSFTDAVKTGDIDLAKATDILKAVTDFLDEIDISATKDESLDIINEIKKVLGRLGGHIFDEDEEGEGLEAVEIDEDIEDDLEEIEIDEDEEVEEIELDEDQEIEEIEDLDEDIEEVELDDDDELEEIDTDIEDDIEEIEIDEDEEVEEIELDEDQEIEEVEDLDENIEEVELDDDDELEEIDTDIEDDLEEIEIDEDEDVEEIELDEDQEIEEVEDLDEDIEEVELDDDDELEEIDTDIEDDLEEIEIDEDEDVEEIELDEDQEIEDIQEIDLDEDEELDEIELDEDEELEEIDELDEEELQALEDFRNARESAEHFDDTLGEREKKFNAYIKIPKGIYTIGTEKSLKSSLELQQFEMPLVYMGKYPVTNALFEIFIEQTGYVTTAERKGVGVVYHSRYQKKGKTASWRKQAGSEEVKGACWYQPSGPGSTLHEKRNHPVVQISVEDALAYASWIGRRLPTEAEWEAAARTDLGFKFPWGNQFDPKALNIEQTGISDTSDVETYDAHANEFGMTDMLGNVMEWTADRQSPPFKTRDGQKYNVAKGGAWNGADAVTISSRGVFKPDFTANTIGFRCISELFQ